MLRLGAGFGAIPGAESAIWGVGLGFGTDGRVFLKIRSKSMDLNGFGVKLSGLGVAAARRKKIQILERKGFKMESRE